MPHSYCDNYNSFGCPIVRNLRGVDPDRWAVTITTLSTIRMSCLTKKVAIEAQQSARFHNQTKFAAIAANLVEQNVVATTWELKFAPECVRVNTSMFYTSHWLDTVSRE